MGRDELEARALALVDEALDQPSPTRAAWLADRTGEDPTVLARARAILTSESAAASALRTGGAGQERGEEPVPEHIGAYRITGLIGQGGMGAVYRGVRDAGDFEHVAAIKVVRPGALSEALVERFERERQLLATLNHPHIARLYDGGESQGAPYIVMEYVEGEPLTEWCDRHAVGRARRLRLFRDVCTAVAYAHQNRVVHRDITPSNVLVTEGGVPKLIDFGIAQDSERLETASRAGVDSRSFTPGYAAPERSEGHPGNTLSDIYSLGRLMAELLGPDERDPDLLAIVARATGYEPESRYPTAEALIDDLERYAAGRVVAARAGGATYAFAKFAGRNRALVALTGMALGLLLAAVVGTSVGLVRAERERARFELERDRARAVNRFVNRMLGSVSPEADGRDVRMVDALGNAASELEADRQLEPAVKATLHLTLGRTYYELGVTEAAVHHLERAIALFEPGSEGQIDARAQLSDVLVDLGEYERAEAEAAAVERAVAQLLDPPPALALRPLELRANLSWSAGSAERTIALHRELLAAWLAVAPPGEENVETARSNLAVALLRADELVEAEALLRESLAARRVLFGPRHPRTLTSAGNLAMTLSDMGRPDETLDMLLPLMPVARSVWGPVHPMTLVFENNLASTYLELGRLEEAYERYEVQRDRHLARYGPEHHETQLARNNLAVCAMRLERFDVAYAELLELLEISQSLRGSISRLSTP